MGLNNVYSVFSDGGKGLVLHLGGAVVDNQNGLGSQNAPSSPMFGHTAAMPLYRAHGTTQFFGNGSNAQSAPIPHGFPSVKPFFGGSGTYKYQILNVQAIGVNSWGATPYLQGSVWDGTYCYLAWYLPQAGGVFGPQTYTFAWSVDAQLLS